jgi:hypothetical protein
MPAGIGEALLTVIAGQEVLRDAPKWPESRSVAHYIEYPPGALAAQKTMGKLAGVHVSIQGSAIDCSGPVSSEFISAALTAIVREQMQGLPMQPACAQ